MELCVRRRSEETVGGGYGTFACVRLEHKQVLRGATRASPLDTTLFRAGMQVATAGGDFGYSLAPGSYDRAMFYLNCVGLG